MERVLITGATSGIGLELAKCFALSGHDLIIVASNPAILEQTRTELEAAYRVKVTAICQDLAAAGGAEQLYEKISAYDLAVAILINNAGIGVTGPAETIAMEADEAMMMVNIINLVKLCKLFLPAMYQRGYGKILNVASTGGYGPGPYVASYFASKSFVLNYTKAIRVEARKKGVAVCVIAPGTTRTGFFDRQDLKMPLGAMDPAVVARQAYRQLERNQGELVPGLLNKLLVKAPEALKIAVIARIKNRTNK